MKFLAKDYKIASMERINTARKLYAQKEYVLAIYIAGVAVECLLKAYLRRKTPHFKSKHDLPNLLKESGLMDFIRPTDHKELSACFGEVWSRWKNNYRYASSERLTSEYKRLKLYNKKVKGYLLKANSSTITNNALSIISKRVARWDSKTN